MDASLSSNVIAANLKKEEQPQSAWRAYLPAGLAIGGSFAMLLLKLQFGSAFIGDGALMMLALAAYWRGAASVQSMCDYHRRTCGWSDIAQHITIDPDGVIWTGRNWNQAPASSGGFNGTSAVGPFMFETVGNFDVGRDPFDGPQREAVLEVIARVQTMLRGTPPPWLRKELLKGQQRRHDRVLQGPHQGLHGIHQPCVLYAASRRQAKTMVLLP